MLFVGTEKGSIYAIKLTSTNSIIDTQIFHDSSYVNVHQGAVTKVCLIFLKSTNYSSQKQYQI